MIESTLDIKTALTSNFSRNKELECERIYSDHPENRHCREEINMAENDSLSMFKDALELTSVGHHNGCPVCGTGLLASDSECPLCLASI